MAKATKKKKISKTAFILNLPETLSAEEVVKKAKSAGIKVNDKYVYNVRSQARNKAKAKKKVKVKKSKVKNGKPKIRADVGGSEETFVNMALEIGLSRAENLLSETRRIASEAVATA